MPLTVHPLPLPLRTPWRIAHGTSTQRTNALVRLGDGFGEGALPPYYPYTFDDVARYVEALDADALLRDPQALEAALDRLPPGPAPARTALDLALHDCWAKHLGHPLYRLWGLSPENAPPTALSFGIPEDLEALRTGIREAAGFPVLKLKLGTGNLERDEAIVRTARETTDADLCVDANGGWSVDESAAIIPRLAGFDLLFVEQPLSAGDPQAWHALRRRLPADAPLLIADESVQSAADLFALRGAVDGVNLKLVKAGGLRPTRRLIALARALDLRVMLGCMIESTVAVTAAAHLAPLADYADLDGPLQLAADPFDGVVIDRGRLVLPERPGLGVIQRRSTVSSP